MEKSERNVKRFIGICVLLQVLVMIFVLTAKATDSKNTTSYVANSGEVIFCDLSPIPIDTACSVYNYDWELARQDSLVAGDWSCSNESLSNFSITPALAFEILAQPIAGPQVLGTNIRAFDVSREDYISVIGTSLGVIESYNVPDVRLSRAKIR